MSRRNSNNIRNNSVGFTIIELMVVLVLVGVLTTNMYVFITGSTNQYLTLHADSASFSDLSIQSQRIANVLRGLTDITEASNDGITMYAYFVPNDTYVSIIQYYKNNEGTKLLADVTPMTANPPIGTPITAKKKTFTIIDNLKNVSGINNFDYLDSAGGLLTMPIADLNTIKGIKVNLAVPVDGPTQGGNSSVSLSVALRNRKTNL
ncbi:MAG: hypothetical protein QG628_375 [Patescibacteria group bacterium]|nr:hypothetical protein [Patescibacteria group bacterium]